jgi:hypothetical protein
MPSPALGDTLNAGYLYLEARCLGCATHHTVALDTVRRPKATPIHELERYMRCKFAGSTITLHMKIRIISQRATCQIVKARAFQKPAVDGRRGRTC